MIRFYFVLFIITCISCGNNQKKYTIEVENGITVVHNKVPVWNDNSKIELEFIRKFGGLEEKEDSNQLFRPMDIIVDKKGNKYINDQGNYRIQKYSLDGKYLGSIGSKGMGPGEFLHTTTVDMDRLGNLFIFDIFQNKVKILSKEGKELYSISENDTKSKLPLDFVLLKSDKILGQIKKSLDKEFQFQVLDLKGNELNRIVPVKFKVENKEDLTKSAALNNIRFCVDHNDNIYVTYLYHNIIEVYNSKGELLKLIDRPLNYDVSDSYSRVKKKIENREFSFVGMNSISNGIAIDGKERIWVRTFERQLKNSELSYLAINTPDGVNVEYKTYKNKDSDEPKPDLLSYHIFDKNGIWLTKIPALYYVSFKIYNDRLFIIDVLNDMSISEYKIIEK